MVRGLSAAALLAACGGSSGPTGPSGPPAITVVNGATLPSGTIGATVVIEGHNFGTSQGVASGHVVFSTTAGGRDTAAIARDRKSTRLNSSHSQISYAVFCLKKKTYNRQLPCLCCNANR